MNRGGLTGSSWELDDRFTAYDVPTIAAMGLDGGKMLLRIDYSDPGTNETLVACSRAVGALAERSLIAMVEPLPARRDPDGRVRVVDDPDLLVEAVAVASATRSCLGLHLAQAAGVRGDGAGTGGDQPALPAPRGRPG